MITKLLSVTVLLWVAGCGGSDDGDSNTTSGGPESSFYSQEPGGGGGESSGSGLVTIQVKMASTKPNGDDWDAFGGQPDPYIKVGGISFESEGCQNTRYCSFQVSGTGPFAVEVYDADVTGPDDGGSTVCALGNTCTTDNGGASVTIK